MIKQERGFTLIELLITMVIFILVIAAGSQIFTSLLTQFKQQSKIAETNIEGIVGLEILRQDIERAGYGLPWNLSGASYQEAAVNSTTPWIDRDFNDGPPDNPARGTDPAGASNPPGGIRSGNNVNPLNGSDVLVIKATSIARSNPSQRWTTLKSTAPQVRTWTPANENLSGTDRVIVLNPGATELNSRALVVNGAAFSTTYSNVTSAPWIPTDVTETRIVYAVDPDTNLRMPFNRADYYIRIPTTMPQRCANNTGILYKATVNQSNGLLTELPLLDCVADMQAIYRRDTNDDGTIDNITDDISALTARQIRDQVKEVRVYILAHEGQYDRNYTYSNSTITIPTPPDPGAGLGSIFDFNTSGITNWQNYRWKLYTIVVKPNNLR